VGTLLIANRKIPSLTHPMSRLSTIVISDEDLAVKID
jgi:hypothetical protein